MYRVEEFSAHFGRSNVLVGTSDSQTLEDTGRLRRWVFRVMLLLLLLLLFGSVTVVNQTQTYTRDDLEYVVQFPSSRWQALDRLDVQRHTDFVYGDNALDGYLRLRKRLVPIGISAWELFARDETWQLSSLPGYIAYIDGQGTVVEGRYSTTIFAYEYVEAGVRMEGRIYYLEIDKQTFYSLHFTAAGDKFTKLRLQTDSIAKSFRLKDSDLYRSTNVSAEPQHALSASAQYPFELLAVDVEFRRYNSSKWFLSEGMRFAPITKLDGVKSIEDGVMNVKSALSILILMPRNLEVPPGAQSCGPSSCSAVRRF